MRELGTLSLLDALACLNCCTNSARPSSNARRCSAGTAGLPGNPRCSLSVSLSWRLPRYRELVGRRTRRAQGPARRPPACEANAIAATFLVPVAASEDRRSIPPRTHKITPTTIRMIPIVHKIPMPNTKPRIRSRTPSRIIRAPTLGSACRCLLIPSWSNLILGGAACVNALHSSGDRDALRIPARAGCGGRSRRSCRLSRKPTLQSWVARPMTFGDLETGRELSCRADRGWWRPTLRDALGNSVLSPATLRGADSLCRWSSG